MGAESDEEDKQHAAEVAYWEDVWKSNRFEVDHLKRPKRFGFSGFVPANYDDELPRFIVYAKVGIHKFNMSKGTNLQFHCLEKLNWVPEAGFRTYHITTLAKDPVRGSCGHHLQTSVVHPGHRKKCLTWFTARIKPKHPGPGRLHYGPGSDCYRRELPEWPPENDFNDKKHFHLVEESELLKYDWIRLYMEFAFVEGNVGIVNPDQ